MSNNIRLRLRPDGDVRGFWDDALVTEDASAKIHPVRASHILVDAVSGTFIVDLSPLGDYLNDAKYKVCLSERFTRRQAAIDAEVAWVTKNYIEGDYCE